MEKRDFQKGYEALMMPLGMYALRIVGDVDTAQDVVQNAFEAAWEHVDEIENLKAYMYRTVRHAALLAARESGRFEEVPLSYCEDVAEEDVDTSERDARLWKALDSLPERCRKVFILSKRDGLSNAEIAEELGISVKTVENQMTKAYSRLRGERDLLLGSSWILTFF